MIDPIRGIAESALLADALELDSASLRLISRAPFGAGAVAGFEVTTPAEPPFTVFVDTSLQSVPVETGLAHEGGARVWRHPADPYLPALLPVAFGHAAADLLGRAGIRETGAPEMIAYRPGRRAVLRVPVGNGADATDVWVKVVRPRDVGDVVARHTALAGGGAPVPRVRAWSPEGVIVLARTEGSPATRVTWEAAQMADAVEELRRTVSTIPIALSARVRVLARVDWYRDRLRDLLPAEASRIRALAAFALAGAAPSARADVTIHGDLHLGQLFLGSTGSVAGLIDTDTAGYGDPAEDEAAFLGHTAASCAMTEDPRARASLRALIRELHDRWGHRPRTGELTIAHLLGHALTFAEQGDTARAERMLDSADEVTHGRPPLAERT